MRYFVMFIGLVLCVAAPAMAQEAPKAEFFAGYEYLRLNPGGIGCHGLGANLAYNLNDWAGAVGDFGVCRETGAGSGFHDVNYLFGPRVSYRHAGRVVPYGQVLFGGQHVGGNGGSANSFAMTLGGGVDYKYKEHFNIRLIQAEYLLTHFSGFRQNNARIQVGLVYTW